MPPTQLTVKRINCSSLHHDWDAEPWKSLETHYVQEYMGDKPEHFPKTAFKIAYDDHAIYVIFNVHDQYVRATAKAHQHFVHIDSCVEFFVAPSQDVSKGYYNLETNCGGTMLFHFQVIPRQNAVTIADAELEKIKIVHSLPKHIDPEISEPTSWQLAYALPLSILETQCDMDKPGPGVTWRANFYKCADECSHPHWLTWAPVTSPKPDFHRPESFGELLFE